MKPEESKLVGEALEQLEHILDFNHPPCRSRLTRARDALVDALNWSEDEPHRKNSDD